MRRAFVTGAHGLVGRWLVAALLDRGVAVSVLARSPGRRSALVLDGLEARCEVVRGELADAAALARAVAGQGSDTVFHLAAQSLTGEARRAPAATFEVNVRGTRNLLEACRTPTVDRVVVASSERAREPAGPYDASKACAELVARSYAAAHGVPVAVARLANVYGPGDLEDSRLVPALVGAALGRGPAVIRSDGSPERDLLYAADAADALIAIAGLAAPGPPGGAAFTVASGTSHAVREVVAALEAVAGETVAVEYRGTAAAPEDRHRADAAALRERTGWAPQVALAEGLRRTLEWHRAHPPVP